MRIFLGFALVMALVSSGCIVVDLENEDQIEAITIQYASRANLPVRVIIMHSDSNTCKDAVADPAPKPLAKIAAVAVNPAPPPAKIAEPAPVPPAKIADPAPVPSVKKEVITDPAPPPSGKGEVIIMSYPKPDVTADTAKARSQKAMPVEVMDDDVDAEENPADEINDNDQPRKVKKLIIITAPDRRR